MELSKRMQAVADLLDCHERIADIGCDHGFVSIYLIESGKAKRCLAMDVNEGPMERVKEHIRGKNLTTYVETRLSDGAKAISFVTDASGEHKLEVQAAFIAGMGGRLVIKILTDSMEKFKAMEEFVLQPQSEIAFVRKSLRENGWKIIAEDMVFEDGKFYPMMKVVNHIMVSEKREASKDSSFTKTESGKLYFPEKIELLTQTQLQELYDEFGACLLGKRHPVLFQFLQKEKALYEGILSELKQKDTKKIETRIQEIEEKLIMIQHGLEWFKDEM